MSFLDAQSDGLRLSAKAMDRIPEEESPIVRFVRTPEGKGVGVIRKNGGGEAWRLVEQGSRLVRAGSWLSADHVVVLEGGNAPITLPVSYKANTGYRENICNLLRLGQRSDPSFHASAVPDCSSRQLPLLHALQRRAGIHHRDHLRLLHHPPPCKALPRPQPRPLLSKRAPPSTSAKDDPPRRPHGVGPHPGMDPARRPPQCIRSRGAGVLDARGKQQWVAVHRQSADGPRGDRDGELQLGEEDCFEGVVPLKFPGAPFTHIIFLAFTVVPGSDGHELTIWDSKESEFATGMEYRGVFRYPFFVPFMWSSPKLRTSQRTHTGPRLDLHPRHPIYSRRRLPAPRRAALPTAHDLLRRRAGMGPVHQGLHRRVRHSSPYFPPPN